MDRYEIAVHFKNQRVKRTAFHFPATRYAAIAVKYIEYSIEHNGICLADNVPTKALDYAVVEISKMYDVSIILKSDTFLFSTVYSHKVYSLENLPNKKYVLCYNCFETELPDGYTVVGTVYGYRKGLNFI